MLIVGLNLLQRGEINFQYLQPGHEKGEPLEVGELLRFDAVRQRFGLQSHWQIETQFRQPKHLCLEVPGVLQ